jgi:hypothetical protein
MCIARLCLGSYLILGDRYTGPHSHHSSLPYKHMPSPYSLTSFQLLRYHITFRPSRGRYVIFRTPLYTLVSTRCPIIDATREKRRIARLHQPATTLRRPDDLRVVLEIQRPVGFLHHVLIVHGHAGWQVDLDVPLVVRGVEVPWVHGQDQVFFVVHRAAEEAVVADEVGVCVLCVGR